MYGAVFDRRGFEYEPDIPMLLHFPNADQFICEAPKIVSTYFAYGNHEWLLNEADIKRIEDTGVVILHNTFTKYKDFVIGGLSSPDLTNYWVFQEKWRVEHPDDNRGNLRRSYYYWEIHEERKTVDVSWLSEFEEQDGYKILICHHPEYWSLKEPRLCEHPIDPCFSWSRTWRADKDRSTRFVCFRAGMVSKIHRRDMSWDKWEYDCQPRIIKYTPHIKVVQPARDSLY